MFRETFFLQAIEQAVKRKDKMGTIADHQTGRVDTGGLELVHLSDQNLGVDRHAVPDDTRGLFVEYPSRY